MNAEFKIALAKYLAACVADYASWTKDADFDDNYRADSLKDYEDNLEFEVGKKYIKVVSRKSAHSFICLEDDDKFKKGDILMSASWKAPARNFARGNIFGSYNVRWTGAVI